MVTDQHWATGAQIKHSTLSDRIRERRPEQNGLTVLGGRWNELTIQYFTIRAQHPKYNAVLIIKRLDWHRWTSVSITVISCGQHLSCCVWQLDLSTERRKLTSTVSLSFCRRSCSERRRTLLLLNLHSVCWPYRLSWFTFRHITCSTVMLQCYRRRAIPFLEQAKIRPSVTSYSLNRSLPNLVWLITSATPTQTPILVKFDWVRNSPQIGDFV